ncbi:MAG: hypothetical protein AAF962_27810, partial [Actinomycetota bacterium]
PIERREGRPPELGIKSPAAIAAVHAEVGAAIDAALAFAEESPAPDADSLTRDVYTVSEGVGQ